MRSASAASTAPRAGERLRVLFLEDNRADVELIRKELLKSGFELHAESTDQRERFSELLARGEYDVVIADYGLPGWTGMDALQLLREKGEKTPLILVTGSLGDEMAVQCIKAGACDYVLKDNLARLPHAVRLAVKEVAMERERSHAQEQLRRYAADLERSNRELQDFVSIASHDLQEPLRKIRTFVDRLQEQCGGELDGRVRECLNLVQKAAKRMSSLISALLTYSRLGTEGQPIAPVNLADVAGEVLDDLSDLVQEAAAQVVVGELPVLRADPVQIRQVFQNLISNALTYRSRERRPEVRIGSRKLSSGGTEIFVSDNGIGFDEKYAEQILRPCQRLHTREAYEGIGMGLAICQKIAIRHGGTIHATSRPGQGSTFTLVLPPGDPGHD